MSRAAKPQRLSVVGAVQDIPTMFRGVRWIDAKRQALLLLVPNRNLGILAIVTMRGVDAGKATVYGTGALGSWPTSPKEFAALGRAMTVDEAVELVRKHADAVDAGLRDAVVLRGRWSGTWSLNKLMMPTVVLRRRVGQGVVVVRTGPDGDWLVSAEVDQTWKGGPSRSPVTANRFFGSAFKLGARLIRDELGKLHGESDRRQAHDESYAKKNPIKRGSASKNPLDQVKPLSAAYSSKRRKGKGQDSQASSSPPDRVVVRIEESDGVRWMEIRERGSGNFHVRARLSKVGERGGALGIDPAVQLVNQFLRGEAGKGSRFVAKTAKVPGLMLPVMHITTSKGADRRKAGDFTVCREPLVGGGERYWSEEFRHVGGEVKNELATSDLNKAIALSAGSMLVTGIPLSEVKLGGRTARNRLKEAVAFAESQRTRPQASASRVRLPASSAGSRTRRNRPSTQVAKPKPLTTGQKDAALRDLFMAGIREAMRG